MAQSVEHVIGNDEVISSILITSSRKKHVCFADVLFSVIFACGEFYCFAVIFGLRRVIFASRVLKANISC